MDKHESKKFPNLFIGEETLIIKKKEENLEWCTDAENKIHAYANGLMIGGNKYSKIRQDLPRYK